MVGRQITLQPNKSEPTVVPRSTIAYGSMMRYIECYDFIYNWSNFSEQHGNTGASSLTFSSDTSETSPFINTRLYY